MDVSRREDGREEKRSQMSKDGRKGNRGVPQGWRGSVANRSAPLLIPVAPFCPDSFLQDVCLSRQIRGPAAQTRLSSKCENSANLTVWSPAGFQSFLDCESTAGSKSRLTIETKPDRRRERRRVSSSHAFLCCSPC